MTALMRNGSGFGKVFLIGLLMLVAVLALTFARLSAQTTSIVDAGSIDSTVYVDFTDAEWLSFTNAEYNVDVYIRTGHAAQEHGAEEMNAALRACNENGTVTILSENTNRRLHLLCQDAKSGRQFVVIIQKIKKAIDTFQNASSELVTAFELKAGGIQPNIAAYINGTVNIERAAIIIRLGFKAGEIFFSPYKK